MESLTILKSLSSVFKKHGYHLYMIGGTSRDFLLGKKTYDLDFVTDATPNQMKEFLENVDTTFVSLGSLRIKYFDYKIDLTTLREEGKYQDYRHPSNIKFIKDLELDSKRRDFTINAIYIDADGKIYDFYNGVNDLGTKTLRMIGEPNDRLKEDPLRILRALRFSLIYDFEIEPSLRNALMDNRAFLRKISFDKCLVEINKMKSHSLMSALELLNKYHIDEIIPLNYKLNRLKTCDMHCDTITVLKNTGNQLLNNKFQIDINKLIEGEYLLQCFAVFIRLNEGNPFERANKYIDFFYEQMEKFSSVIAPVTALEEINNNYSKHKISALLTIEEGGVLEGELSNLDYFYNRGVRMLTLTWNFPNQIGYPNFVFLGNKKPDLLTPNTHDGLTPFGIKVVKRMNELGMIIDVSHLSDAGFYDVIKYSKKPIVASHSNSRGVQNIVRNMTDDMIRALSENGGIMGINYCPNFVSDSKDNQIEDLVKHIKHIVDVGGVNVVALGSDFDGIPTPNGMCDASKTTLLYKELIKNGFSRKDCEKIFHENFLRVLKANLN